MSIIYNARILKKEIINLQDHILSDSPSRDEKKAVEITIQKLWSEFCSDEVVKKYNFSRAETNINKIISHLDIILINQI